MARVKFRNFPTNAMKWQHTILWSLFSRKNCTFFTTDSKYGSYSYEGPVKSIDDAKTVVFESQNGFVIPNGVAKRYIQNDDRLTVEIWIFDLIDQHSKPKEDFIETTFVKNTVIDDQDKFIEPDELSLISNSVVSNVEEDWNLLRTVAELQKLSRTISRKK